MIASRSQVWFTLVLSFFRPQGGRRLLPPPRWVIHGPALTVSLILLCTVCFAASGPEPWKTGGLAPSFALPDINGKQYRREDFTGKPVVLNFWAFWCDTWKAEMPSLKDLAARQQELGFRLAAISVDGTRVQEFQRRKKGDVPFPVLLDVGGQVSRRYHVAHVPTVVILDAGGRVRFVASGYPGNHVVLRELRKIAAER